MSDAVRTIQLPSATALSTIVQRLRAALASWVCEWTLGGFADAFAGAAVNVRSVEAKHAPRTADFATVQTSAGSLWVRSSPADFARLGRCVVGDALMPLGSWADDWVADLVTRAWDARNCAIAAALLDAAPAADTSQVVPESVGAVPANLFAFGAGSVHLSCELLGLNAVADRSIWRSTPPQDRVRRAHGQLTPLEAAAQNATVRIDVVLGAVELDVLQLLDLRCGDVLRLPQSLDEGLGVHCEGHLLARGTPGERRGRKCVQLTSLLANS
jgi:hypothetical protein